MITDAVACICLKEDSVNHSRTLGNISPFDVKCSFEYLLRFYDHINISVETDSLIIIYTINVRQKRYCRRNVKEKLQAILFTILAKILL